MYVSIPFFSKVGGGGEGVDVGYFYYKLIQIETIYLKNKSQTGVCHTLVILWRLPKQDQTGDECFVLAVNVVNRKLFFNSMTN